MASAEDEEMAELKSLEEVACSAKLTAINTTNPSLVSDKNFNGKRTAKDVIAEDRLPVIPTPQVKTK